MCREFGEQPAGVPLEVVSDDIFLCGVDLEDALLECVVYEFLSDERFCDHGCVFEAKIGRWSAFVKDEVAIHPKTTARVLRLIEVLSVGFSTENHK